MKHALDIATRIAISPIVAAGLVTTVVGITTVACAVLAYGYITTPKENR